MSGPADAAARVALRTAREQGLPEVLEDPAVLDRLAGLLDLTPNNEVPASRIGSYTTPGDGLATPRTRRTT